MCVGGVLQVRRETLFSLTSSPDMPRRKKEDELPLDQRGPPRGAANLRERTRMRILSKAFGKLKLMLPWVPPDTKLSKLDTLRLATSYISHLQRILDENENDLEDTKFQATNLVSTQFWQCTIFVSVYNFKSVHHSFNFVKYK